MSSPEREIRSLVENFAAAIAELMERELHAVFDVTLARRSPTTQRALALAEPPRPTPLDPPRFADFAAKVIRLLADNAGGARRIGDAAIVETLQAAPAVVARTLRALIDAGHVITRGSGRTAWYELASEAASSFTRTAAPVAKPSKPRMRATAVATPVAVDPVAVAPAGAPGSTGAPATEATGARKSRAKGPSQAAIEELVEAGLRKRQVEAAVASDEPGTAR